MSVFDNVAFPLKMRRRPKAEIVRAVGEVLSLVHLEDFAARLLRQLSGGQQQRVALARAIVFRPPLLLMDEPLGALDRQLRKEVQYELKRIQRKLGLTVIYVTHDHDEALFLSDTIAIMEGGRIAQAGPPPALYESPKSRFVAEFLGESNFVSATLAELGDSHATVRLPDGTTIAGRPIGFGPDQGPGSAVDVLVRPEKLDVLDAGGDEGDGPDGAGNRVSGTIDMVSFLGSQLEYEIRTAGGMLAARSYLRSSASTRTRGAAVSLRFSEGDCMIFPASGDGA